MPTIYDNQSPYYENVDEIRKIAYLGDLWIPSMTAKEVDLLYTTLTDPSTPAVILELIHKGYRLPIEAPLSSRKRSGI